MEERLLLTPLHFTQANIWDQRSLRTLCVMDHTIFLRLRYLKEVNIHDAEMHSDLFTIFIQKFVYYNSTFVVPPFIQPK